MIAGSHTVAATAGMLAWGAMAGLLGAYGNAGAAMGLPVVWTYLELGLTTPVYTLWHAFALAALYAVGGVWAVTLALLINVMGPFGPLREQVTKCYAVLGAYLEGTLRAHANPAAPDVISPETRVRQAIARARLLAARTRQGQPAASDVGQRLLALVEIADQLLWLGAALGDSRAVVSAPGHSEAVMSKRSMQSQSRSQARPTRRPCIAWSASWNVRSTRRPATKQAVCADGSLGRC